MGAFFQFPTLLTTDNRLGRIAESTLKVKKTIEMQNLWERRMDGRQILILKCA